MPSRDANLPIAVFDLGGTWFRWGLYSTSQGLMSAQRGPAISYVSHPDKSAVELQAALGNFIIEQTKQMRRDWHLDFSIGCVSVGAPVNAHDMTVLGSGPLWGPAATPFQLQSLLREALPEVTWLVINDITALLAPYMGEQSVAGERMPRKTLLITVSSGIGSRLFDHQAARIPYDPRYGVQGEIGHLTITFALDGKIVNRSCECGGANHLNAFSSGRGIAQILKGLPASSLRIHRGLSADPEGVWTSATDDYRLSAFKSALENDDDTAMELLEALVSPLSRTLASALSLDPEIERIVVTGGVVQGFGVPYREALHRIFLRDGLYQITEQDPDYLTRRLQWKSPDDFEGLRGAGVYASGRSFGHGHGHGHGHGKGQ